MASTHKTGFPRVRGRRRPGNVVAQIAIAGTALFGFAAVAIDVSMLYLARNQAQVAADAAALAAAHALLTEDRLHGEGQALWAVDDARTSGVDYGLMNAILRKATQLDRNEGNAPEGDIVVGYMPDPEGNPELMLFDDPTRFNAVQVLVHRDETRNGPILMMFGKVFGMTEKGIMTRATAVFEDGIVGYKVTERTGNAKLLPFAVHKDAWDALMSGELSSGDKFTVDPETGAVWAGSDGLNELNIYPGSGSGQLPPGNFGTVDIGSENNSTSDISRQILYGVSESDLAYFGGEMRIDDDGLPLNGDTGLSAAVKDDLMAIRGQPRAIPLFTEVWGPGNNAYFTIVGFAGVRVVDVKLTGPMNKKYVLIQPACVVDDAALHEKDGLSYYVYRPPMLIR